MSWLMAHLPSYLVQDAVQLAILVLLSLNCALVGPFLLLRHQTMLANSISHTVLLGIAAAFLLESIAANWGIDKFICVIACSALVAWLTTFATQKAQDFLQLQEDASVGMVFSGLFALGIMAVSACFPHSHVGLEIIMGNADSLAVDDVYPLIWSFLINSLLVIGLFKEYKLTTFDRSLANSMGFEVQKIDYLLMTQVTLTMMVGFRAVGSFLVLSFLIGPALCARFVTHKLKSLIWVACGFGASSALIACLLARMLLQSCRLPLSTAGLSSSVLFALFLILWVYKMGEQRRKQRNWM